MDLNTAFPRAGETVLGGYPWLARMIDKARAYNEGTLGDYIYPCPIDKELLAEINFTGEEFAEIVEQCQTDAEVLGMLDLPEENTDPAVRRWTIEFLTNRHDSLTRQAEEEGRTYHPPDGVEIIRPFA
jgi:hypothetical protein